MRPDELKAYLKTMHADQAKPTAKTQPNSRQTNQTSDSSLKQQTTSAEIDWKDKGNVQFKSGNYTAAITCYGNSIEAQPTCVAYANRAMAQIKLKNYDSAVKDCTAALNLDENYVKAWLRRGTAHRELGLLEKAIADFETALRLEPGNKGAMEDRIQCINKWVENNNKKETPSGSHSSSGDLFSRSASVPVVLEETKEAVFTKTTKLVEEMEPLPSIPPLVTATHELPQAPQQPVPSPVMPLQTQTPFKAPKTGVDFERSWRGFKGNLEQQAVYLRQIDPEKLPMLLKQVLTPSLIVNLQLTVLAGPLLRAQGEEGTSRVTAAAAVGILKALPNVARFSMNVLSLSAAQKKELSAAWDTACIDFSELNNLRAPYSV
jgi:tetratricopeptide (TPR) repeat protein